MTTASITARTASATTGGVVRAPAADVAAPSAYERRVASDYWGGLGEAAMYFDGKGSVQTTLRRICDRLRELGIPHAVCGGMAVFHYGFRRLTEDVDLLVTADSLKAIHERLDGLGYVRVFRGSKAIRDTETGVKIDFLVAGGFPGDGKPKPVTFPDPSAPGVTVEAEGMTLLALPKLVELKLASGMSSTGRLKDLADVQELIKSRDLPAEFGATLDASVRGKFDELWSGAREYWSDSIDGPNA